MLRSPQRDARSSADFALAGLVLVASASLFVPHHPDLLLPLVIITGFAALIDDIGAAGREHRRVVKELDWIAARILPVVGAEHHEALLLESAVLRRLATAWRRQRRLRNVAMVAAVCTGLFGLNAGSEQARSAWFLVQGVLLATLLLQARAALRARRELDEHGLRFIGRLHQAGPARGVESSG